MDRSGLRVSHRRDFNVSIMSRKKILRFGFCHLRQSKPRNIEGGSFASENISKRFTEEVYCFIAALYNKMRYLLAKRRAFVK